MNLSRLGVTVACLSIVCCLFSGAVFGLDNVNLTILWSDDTLAPGDYAIVTVIFANADSEDLTVHYFGLHFDWMETDRFIGADLSEDPVTILAGESYTFSGVTVQIPSNVTEGTHNYFVGMDGYEDNEVFTWDSETKEIVIQSSWQEMYNELIDQTATNMSIAENVTYKSPDAQSLLTLAQDAYSLAQTYATEENWEQAIAALKTVSNYLEQAETEEANYVEPESEQDSTLIIIIAIAAAAIVIVIVAMLLRRKPKP